MTSNGATIEDLAGIVIDHGFRLHSEIGPGLLEAAYEAFLAASLREAGLDVRQQVTLPARYGRVTVERAFRVDLLIEDKLVVELKSVEGSPKLHAKQLLTYLRLMELPLGLLLNFSHELFRDGVKRVINGRDTHVGRY